MHFTQDGIYFRLGQMSLIHGGAAMRIFGPSVFKHLSGMKPCDIIVGINEVPDSSVCEKLYKVYTKISRR